MAPALLSDLPTHSVVSSNNNEQTYPREPLKLSGALEKAVSFEDLTPTIGREFPTVNIVNDLFNAENADELLRDLAITSMC